MGNTLFHLNFRSLSVPYAYQCCAFWGCDSYLNSNAEDSSHQDQGALMDREKGKCFIVLNRQYYFGPD